MTIEWFKTHKPISGRMDGRDGRDGIGSPGGRGYRAPYGANNDVKKASAWQDTVGPLRLPE